MLESFPYVRKRKRKSIRWNLFGSGFHSAKPSGTPQICFAKEARTFII